MKLLAEQTVAIRCDVHTAFVYASDMENFNQWFPGVRSIVSANSLPPTEPGKEYLEVVATPAGEERQVLVRVRQVEPDRLFVTEGEYPPLMPRMEIELRTEGANGCVVTWRMLSRNDAPESELPWLPIARQAIGERAQVGVAQLKMRLESRCRD
jgi:hypothetical protein